MNTHVAIKTLMFASLVRSLALLLAALLVIWLSLSPTSLGIKASLAVLFSCLVVSGIFEMISLSLLEKSRRTWLAILDQYSVALERSAGLTHGTTQSRNGGK